VSDATVATPGDLVHLIEQVVAELRERGQRLEVIDLRDGELRYRAVPADRATT
jgi:pyruvate/2-oxoglutarate/acetoin dehydrogenase E1 component